MVSKKFIIPRSNAIRGFLLTILIILGIIFISGYLVISASSNITQMGALFLLIAFGLAVIIHLNGGLKELTLRKNSIKLKPK